MKICSVCDVKKFLILFPKGDKYKDGYRGTCKRCTALAASQWHRLNRPTLSSAEKKQRAETRKAATRERVKVKQKIYAKKYPSKRAYYSSMYRARKIQRTPSWLTLPQLKMMQDMYDKSAALSSLTGEIYHVDHIVPLKGKSVSGLHVPWNLQILTAVENCLKSNK